MKTIFFTPTRRRIFLVFCRFTGLPESGRASGRLTWQLPAGSGGQMTPATLLGNQRFAQAQ